ncbi:hypothetical protein NEOLEDRAFT_1178389 [Neolentinus lepideus HHB14362 ss-1]|uniref:Uncharacterized protein n=1 Tax=Neolentinus lepideus HHB14362 ss-1 TaxID=1314782 RepID=A0A165SSM5_9AGAM|nr:hypothetical protein NEOLEDRAFT_1178389 [Neolentinus lepideus HHB14362 ss-1]
MSVHINKRRRDATSAVDSSMVSMDASMVSMFTSTDASMVSTFASTFASTSAANSSTASTDAFTVSTITSNGSMVSTNISMLASTSAGNSSTVSTNVSVNMSTSAGNTSIASMFASMNMSTSMANGSSNGSTSITNRYTSTVNGSTIAGGTAAPENDTTAHTNMAAETEDPAGDANISNTTEFSVPLDDMLTAGNEKTKSSKHPPGKPMEILKMIKKGMQLFTKEHLTQHPETTPHGIKTLWAALSDDAKQGY